MGFNGIEYFQDGMRKSQERCVCVCAYERDTQRGVCMYIHITVYCDNVHVE